MREVRIYQAGSYQQGQTLELSPEAGQHVGVVLRMQVGDEITLFSGANHECLAVIESVKKRQVQVRLGTVREVSRESTLSIHLAQAISKGDRMDLVMQKAVELGVASITPIITQRCSLKLEKERLAKKLQQWQAIVIAACEQSGRNTVPTVNAVISLDEFLANNPRGLCLLLDPKAQKSWRDYAFNNLECSLLIGPEGGLSDEEIQTAHDKGFHSLSLGPRILRTETAAIAALSILQAVAGDF